jgi:hypothetical protein
MGGIGRCCCTCECLPIEDLPTVTISGYTGGGWSGSCCYEQTFTPNTTPSWSKSCSSLLYEGSVLQECTTLHTRQGRGSYRGFEYGPLGGDCSEVPEDYCCGGSWAPIAETQSTVAYTDNAFMAVWRRPKNIIVRISQEEVDCEGVEGQTGGCKIVIRSRFNYEYETAIYQNGLTSGSQTVTMLSTDCFEVNPDYEITIGAGSPITCSDVPANPPPFSGSNLCRNSGVFGFDRVRYYDEMPTGAIQFTNAEVPGCDASSCNYEPYNYASSVCINSPSSPSALTGCFFNEPCYCTDEVTSGGPIIESEAENCFNDGLGQSPNVTDIDGCFADPCIPAVSCTTNLTICATPEYECPGTAFSVNCLDFEINPENEATCFRPGVGFPFGGFSACGCGISVGGAGAIEPPYFDTSDCFSGNCNEACCDFLDDCECCLPDGRCLPKFAQKWNQTVTDHTRTQTCSGFSSQSVCTGAPSWTINLA